MFINECNFRRFRYYYFFSLYLLSSPYLIFLFGDFAQRMFFYMFKRNFKKTLRLKWWNIGDLFSLMYCKFWKRCLTFFGDYVWEGAVYMHVCFIRLNNGNFNRGRQSVSISLFVIWYMSTTVFILCVRETVVCVLLILITVTLFLEDVVALKRAVWLVCAMHTLCLLGTCILGDCFGALADSMFSEFAGKQ